MSKDIKRITNLLYNINNHNDKEDRISRLYREGFYKKSPVHLRLFINALRREVVRLRNNINILKYKVSNYEV